MGKNLKNADLVLRTGKMAFYLVPGNSAHTRMEGFTSLSTSKNPTAYERQYVDEDFKRTDITGYNVSTAYALDRYKRHPVTDDIINIHENELLGKDAIRNIIQVDMTTATGSGNSWTARGKMRDYAVIPDADGDTTDCMTYSGNFKTRGEMEEVNIVTKDNFQTITIDGQETAPVLQTLEAYIGNTKQTLTPEFAGSRTSYTIAGGAGTYRIHALAESATYSVLATHEETSQTMNNAVQYATFSNCAVGDKIYVVVSRPGSGVDNMSRTYTITIAETS